MARKAGFGSTRGPVTGRGRTCVLWALAWASESSGRGAPKEPPARQQASLHTRGGRGAQWAAQEKGEM